MTTLVMPIDSDDFSYDFQINLENVIYTLDFDYNTRSEQWRVSVFDSSGENLLLGAIPILTDIPILYPFRNTEGLPPGEFVALDETGQGRNASRDNFGTEIKLFYDEANIGE